jgi:hypothetical protein
MALNKYVLTSTITLTQGTAATVVAGETNTGGLGGFPTTGGPAFPVMLIKGTPIVLDPAGQVYAAIGAGNLRAWVDGQDAVGHAALGN